MKLPLLGWCLRRAVHEKEAPKSRSHLIFERTTSFDLDATDASGNEAYVTDAMEAIKQMYTNVGTDVSPLTLEGIQGWVRVVDIYDGDTCKVICKIPGMGYRKVTCRLSGIDTPEINSKNTKEKDLALKAKLRFFKYLFHPDVFDAFVQQNMMFENIKKETFKSLLNANTIIAWAEFGAYDKYGRVLVTVRTIPIKASINQVLVREGLAVNYNGGTKNSAW